MFRITALLLPLALLLPVPAVPAQDAAAPPALLRERIEWCDVWHTDADKEDLPRVLLIGDSITRGYFDAVEQSLGEAAHCSRYTTSRSVCDPVFFQELSLILSQYPYRVIHFNNGLHGWGYTEAQYAAGFDRLLAALRAEAPGARLVWACTTPVQPGSGMADDRHRVAERNALAAARVQEAGIPVNDLYALSVDHPEHFSGDGVHFSPAGKAVQAEAVTAAVKKALETPAP